MRLPKTIPDYIFDAYRCSEETTQLPNELNRTLRSEDEHWDDRLPAELKIQAMNVIARNWARRPLLAELPPYADFSYLFETLPVDLPFELAISRITCQQFWERLAESRWQFNDPAEYGDCWLRLYCERHVAELLEELDPRYFESEREQLEATLRLVSPHVRRLKLRQLRPFRQELQLSAPEGPADEDYEEEQQPQVLSLPPVHHLPLDAVLRRLPLLEELSINIGMIRSVDGSEWRDYEFSVEDAMHLARGVKGLERLRRFGLTRSQLDQPRCAALLHGLVVNLNVVEIDLSHCALGNEGAHAVGAFLKQRRRLKAPGRLRSIKLVNSNIGADGVAGLVCGLMGEPENEPTAVTSIDLRLNPLGDQGAVHIAAMLLRYTVIEELNIATCGICGDGGMNLAEVLASGRTKFTDLRIDCSNNEFGPIVGEAFAIVAKACRAITGLDVRMCGFRKESEYSISESINRNRVAVAKKEKIIEDDTPRPPLPSLIAPLKYLVHQRTLEKEEDSVTSFASMKTAPTSSEYNEEQFEDEEN